MTRPRPAAWLLIAALSLPAMPLSADPTEEPVAEEPKAEEPVVREQQAPESGAGEPASLEPTVEEPAAEEPLAEQPAGEVPETGEPVAGDAVDPEPVTERRPARDRAAPGGPASPAAKPATSRPAARAKQGARKGAGNAAPAATRPTRELSAEEMLSQMLKPPAATGGSRPLPPLPEVDAGGVDKTSGAGAVAPQAPVVNVLREGTFLVDRVGRIQRGADGSPAEFVFEADGTALQDPPVVIVPNLKLMQMEDAAANSTRDLRFRVSGMVTEYRGRNYVLLEKVVVVPEVLEKF